MADPTLQDILDSLDALSEQVALLQETVDVNHEELTAKLDEINLPTGAGYELES